MRHSFHKTAAAVFICAAAGFVSPSYAQLGGVLGGGAGAGGGLSGGLGSGIGAGGNIGAQGNTGIRPPTGAVTNTRRNTERAVNNGISRTENRANSAVNRVDGSNASASGSASVGTPAGSASASTGGGAQANSAVIARNAARVEDRANTAVQRGEAAEEAVEGRAIGALDQTDANVSAGANANASGRESTEASETAQ